MNKIILSCACLALAGAASAQTGADSAATGAFDESATDSSAVQPDSTRYTTFGSLATDDAPTPAARAREERKSARASTTTSPANSAASGSGSARRAGKGVKLVKEGPTVSVARAMDPEGRKHWKRMNKKARRQFRDAPPGTNVPD